MLLVTGGGDSSFEPLASTEVYRHSAGEWREVPGGALPRPMTGVRVATLNNRVLLFGENVILLEDIINRLYSSIRRRGRGLELLHRHHGVLKGGGEVDKSLANVKEKKLSHCFH